MQGIILAAGMGSRLKALTADNTKCMVEVNGVTLIERMLRQIDQRDFSRVVIVTGYEGQKLRDFIATLNISTPIVYVHNEIYDQTNNIYSLALAQDYLIEDDTILFESDLIFEDSVLDSLIDDPRETLALVDKYESWMDGTVIKLDENDHIRAFIPGTHFTYTEADQYYKTVNLYKFSRDFSKTHYLPFLNAYTQALGRNEYYEQVLRVITLLDEPAILAKRLTGQKWYEIDDVQDLDIASSIFHPDPLIRREMFESRFGGYWRYPKLLDFCYLVNPYFPPARMKDEMRASFDRLLVDYPSGMRVNSLLAAKNFGLTPETVVVGNGAAELIKALMEELPAPFGIIRPTFEEYPNRRDDEPVVFYADNKNFSYGADDLIEFFSENPVKSLILINPDNPSGNFIAQSDVLRLAEWTEQTQTRFILDESFIDFADGEDNSLLDEEILERYPHMVIVKSISKSFGVAGLRLGILASGDTDLIKRMKKSVAIWNINSFAEFYLQIEEKYKKHYAVAIDKIRDVRKAFERELSTIPYLRVIPSQANFITCEVLPPFTSATLATQLLEDELLIKDLSPKHGFEGRNYIRLAVRSTHDNEQLIAAFRALTEKA